MVLTMSVVLPAESPDDAFPLPAADLMTTAPEDSYTRELSTMFATLRELYVFCETNERADIAGEVVDALSMCQQDFRSLSDSLRARAAAVAGAPPDATPTGTAAGSPVATPDHERGKVRRASDGAPSGAPSGSPLHGASCTSPLAQLNSPESNSRMLLALEALEFEELQEAARYFEQSSAPGAEMRPRKEHERLYLECAAREGREPAARRFLVTLNRMACAARESSSSSRWTAERARSAAVGPSLKEEGVAADPGKEHVASQRETRALERGLDAAAFAASRGKVRAMVPPPRPPPALRRPLPVSPFAVCRPVAPLRPCS